MHLHFVIEELATRQRCGAGDRQFRATAHHRGDPISEVHGVWNIGIDCRNKGPRRRETLVRCHVDRAIVERGVDVNFHLRNEGGNRRESRIHDIAGADAIEPEGRCITIEGHVQTGIPLEEQPVIESLGVDEEGLNRAIVVEIDVERSVDITNGIRTSGDGDRCTASQDLSGVVVAHQDVLESGGQIANFGIASAVGTECAEFAEITGIQRVGRHEEQERGLLVAEGFFDTERIAVEVGSGSVDITEVVGVDEDAIGRLWSLVFNDFERTIDSRRAENFL